MGGRIEEIHEEIEVDEEEDENVQILERIVMDESCQDTIEMECDFGGIQIKELRSGHKIVFNNRLIISHIYFSIDLYLPHPPQNTMCYLRSALDD